MFRTLPVLLAATLHVMAPMAGTAQQPDPPAQSRRIPVTIVLVERLPLDAPFLVQRRPSEVPHDVIVLRADADVGQLSEAVRALLAARQAGGDFPAVSGTLRVRPAGNGAGNRPALSWAGRVLVDLRRAEPEPVSGIGTVRSVQIWLPPQNRQRTGQ